MRVDRTRPPGPGPLLPARFPAIHKTRINDGLAVWTAEHRALPVLTVVLLVRCGAAMDPVEQPGLAALAADMLDEGSGDRSAIDIHEAVARLGGQLDIETGFDAAMVSLTLLSRFRDHGLALVADMALRPRLAEEDVVRVRTLRVNRLRQMRDVPQAVADRAFTRWLYGPAHPYGHPPMGDEASLAGISVDAVGAFHRTRFVRSPATLIAVGDAAHEEIVAAAREAFAAWGPADAAEPVVTDPADAAADHRIMLLPRPGAPQSELRIGHVAAARATPDYHALLVLNMILGGQFVSRLNLNLREDKGFTYGARTAFEFRRGRGPFSVQVSVQTSSTAAAIAESLREVGDIRGARPVTAGELNLGSAALTRGYPRGFETAEQVARALVQLALYDLPDDYFERFVPSVAAVTPADVTRAALAHLDPSRLVVLVVGDPDAIGAGLDAIGLGAVTSSSANV